MLVLVSTNVVVCTNERVVWRALFTEYMWARKPAPHLYSDSHAY